MWVQPRRREAGPDLLMEKKIDRVVNRRALERSFGGGADSPREQRSRSYHGKACEAGGNRIFIGAASGEWMSRSRSAHIDAEY